MSGSTLVEVNKFTPQSTGGNTYVALLRGGEYIARHRQISKVGNSFLTSFMWSMGEEYSRRIHTECRAQALKLSMGSYSVRAQAKGLPYALRLNGKTNVSDTLCTDKLTMLSVTHELRDHTILWQHAELTPDNTYGHRLSDINTQSHEMLIQQTHGEGGRRSTPTAFIEKTGSFMVRRSLSEAIETFRELDAAACIQNGPNHEPI